MKILIIPFEEKHKTDFINLTREWLTEYFWVEPCDEILFEDPAAAYIQTGGEIFVAVDADCDKAVGFCALVYHNDSNSWEMSKLGVCRDYRNNGIAEKLVDTVIASAKAKGAKELMLDTSIKLKAAVNLYKRIGFIETPLTNTHYQRTDMQMVKPLYVGK